MSSIAVITDSDASLPHELAAANGIRQVPINVHFGEETFQTGVDINDVTLFERVDREKALPTTSAPSPGQFADAFKEALEGCFSIACSKDCARAIALNMLGMDPSEELSNEEVSDAMGEVTNLIMGSIKKNLHEYIDDLIVSVPLVVSGQTLSNNLGDGSEKVTVYLNIEDEHLAELTMSYRYNVNH